MVMNTVAAPTTEFADPPSREDMQNYRQLFYPARPTALKRHLQRVEDNKPPSQRRRVFVMSEMPVRLLPARDSDRFYVPDLTVAFDVDESIIVRDNGFAIIHQDNPPVFALEVASKTTGKRDVNIKRDAYEALRIGEYWRTDPSGGEWHDAPLAGDRLGPDGKYVHIPIQRIGDEILRGYSEALGLYVCWEHGDVRFYDRETGYLLTYIEQEDLRFSESARADAAEAQRDVEREGRLAESARANAAEAARIDAETRRMDAEAARTDAETRRMDAETKRKDAEARARRLQEELRRLRGEEPPKPNSGQ